MILIRLFLCLVITIIFSQTTAAQNLVFRTKTTKNIPQNKALTRAVKNHESSRKINKTYELEITAGFLKNTKVNFQIGQLTYSATLIKKITRGKNSFSWFGKTADGFGIFFTVNNGRISSKFSTDKYAYTLIPLSNDTHLLVEFKDTNIGVCGNEVVESISKAAKSILQTGKLVDDDCTIRVLIATTPTASMQIINAGFDIPTFAQLAIDETNLAYITSQIDMIMELAVLLETNYTEIPPNANTGFQDDLNNFRNGTGDLAITNQMRDSYQTDIQILLRRNVNGFFGQAFNVPTENVPFNQAEAYCTVTVEGVTIGRFSFPHEIGHLQGARHDTHNDNPNYARGFVSGNANNSWRTIMATGNQVGCVLANGCRISAFSNPNINGPDGAPAGTIDRNNGRRINETSAIIKNYREVPDNLNLLNENISSNQVSNHLADLNISTNNSTVIYQANSSATMRSANSIVLQSGTHIQNGANFRAYLVSNACENEPSSAKLQSHSYQTNRFLFNRRLEGNDLASGIILSPNPTKEILNIEASNDNGIISCQVSNLGNLSLLWYINDNEHQSFELDFSSFPAGIYIIRFLMTDGTTVNKKVIKE
ncbi:hypothetical protein MNBD_BACTEROID03-2624 [hydrothermal vent metagenome]|uniref:Secretion system C-terminal sorting domain-containing protein n=1 Tax=hydrothermal vent metagenome TaxID=652676 RepID=A0A3B0TTC5_9ZZZZ